jgi:hypothetical protein
MSDTITCPACRRSLEMPADRPERQVRCPHCAATFVPGTGTEITANPPRPSPAQTAITAAGPSTGPNAPVYADMFEEAEAADRADEVRLSRPFLDHASLALAVKALLGAMLAVDVLLLWSDVLQYMLLNRLAAGADIGFIEWENNDQRQAIVGVVHVLTYIVTGITFLVWFSRTHANLKALGARDLRYTSGWAAGYWFVPFANLVLPVRVAQEIWRHSDPDERVGVNSTLIGYWWLMWIVAAVTGSIAGGMSRRATDLPSVHSATAAHLFADLASIVACMLAIAVVNAIDNRQRLRAAALGHDTALNHGD